MNLKKYLVISLLSTTAFTSFAASDEEVNKEGAYIQLNGGISMGMAPKGDFGKQKAGNSAVYGGEVGYQFTPYFRVGVSLDDRNKYSSTENITFTDQGETSKASTNWKLRSLVAMVNFYYNVFEYNGLTPYLTCGAGIARNEAKGTQVVSNDTSSSSSSIPTGTKSDIAYKVGLGVKYDLNQNIGINVQYQYIDMGKIKTGTNSKFTTTQNGHLRANEFLLGLSYKF